MHNPSVDVLWVSVILKVLVISVHCDWGGGSHEKVTPVVETMHMSEEFTIMDVIVPFSFREHLGVETYGSVFTLVVFLCEDGTSGVCRSVDLEKEWFGRVRLMESRVGKDSVNEGI